MRDPRTKKAVLVGCSLFVVGIILVGMFYWQRDISTRLLFYRLIQWQEGRFPSLQLVPESVDLRYPVGSSKPIAFDGLEIIIPSWFTLSSTTPPLAPGVSSGYFFATSTQQSGDWDGFEPRVAVSILPDTQRDSKEPESTLKMTKGDGYSFSRISDVLHATPDDWGLFRNLQEMESLAAKLAEKGIVIAAMCDPSCDHIYEFSRDDIGGHVYIMTRRSYSMGRIEVFDLQSGRSYMVVVTFATPEEILQIASGIRIQE